MALSIGFIHFVPSTNAIQATGLLTLAPVGLISPTEHASLRWTTLARNNHLGARLAGRGLALVETNGPDSVQLDRWSFRAGLENLSVVRAAPVSI